MFEEMNNSELMDTDGGFPWIPVIIIGVLISGSIASCANACDSGSCSCDGCKNE